MKATANDNLEPKSRLKPNSQTLLGGLFLGILIWFAMFMALLMFIGATVKFTTFSHKPFLILNLGSLATVAGWTLLIILFNRYLGYLWREILYIFLGGVAGIISCNFLLFGIVLFLQHDTS